MAMAVRQRAARREAAAPLGMASGAGTMPSMVASRVRSASMRGIEAMRPSSV